MSAAGEAKAADLATQAGAPVARIYGEPLLEMPRDLYIPPEALEIFLETFEGPLDLLLYLIRKENINVLDIPMAELTRQYLGYVEVMRRTQLELAAEYLLMAAVLIEIKSRLLLPRAAPVPGAEEEEDPRAELVRQLLEYRRYQAAAQELQERREAGAALFWREGEEPEAGVQLEGEVGALDLYAAFERVLAQAQVEPTLERIPRPAVTVKAKMAELLSRLAHAGERGLRFQELFTPPWWRLEVVVTFLALLELVKLGRARVRQRQLFGEIVILG